MCTPNETADALATVAELVAACEMARASAPFMTGRAQITIDVRAWDAIGAALATGRRALIAHTPPEDLDVPPLDDDWGPEHDGPLPYSLTGARP